MTRQAAVLAALAALAAACSTGDSDGAVSGGAGVSFGGRRSSGGPAGIARIDFPSEVRAGRPFPVIVRAANPGDFELPLAANVPVPRVTLREGRGSFSLALSRDAELFVGGPGELRSIAIRVTERPQRRLSGTLAGPDLLWARDDEIILDATVSVPVGATLRIEAGARVLGTPRANVDVLGALEALGEAGTPILFSRAGGEPWGGVHVHPNATATLRHVFITGGGGDPERVFGHSGSQAVVFADAGASLTVEGGGAVDNPGKGYSSREATIKLTDVLVSRCDTGGEHNDSALTVERSHFLEIPDADGLLDDDDNDGLYLSSGAPGQGATRPMLITDTVFAVGEDDGIDHAGALVELRGVRISSMANEGIAASNGGRISIVDAIVRRSTQGIEAGWGAPEVIVSHSLLIENRVGLRFGDDYDTESAGTLRASYVAVVESYDVPVRNLWAGAPGGPRSKPEAISISCSLVGSPDWDGKDGNGTEIPRLGFDGCLEPELHLLVGCTAGPVGPRQCR